MKKELIVQQDPKSPTSEIFRTLRTNIQFMNAKGKLKSLLITSTLPGEGKSWVSSNLAVSFAQAGKKVILIDADMRKGRQYTIFGVSPRPGLSNYLSGIGENAEEEQTLDLDDYIQDTEIENLYLMAAGNVPPNPSELLIAPQMVDLLNRLKDAFDIVIIDGTPSQLVTDSLIITRLVDSTIVITASKQTKKEDLKKVINNIQQVGGKLAGVVLNKIPVSSRKYESRYYYYGSSSNSNSKSASNTRTTRVTPLPTKTNEYEEKFKVPKNDKEDKLPKTVSGEDIMVKDEISADKANEILNQINEYLDKSKNKNK